ncbi:MAG: hypothetical protein D6731_24795 [Planctomycetota bacterium]|nr:MAG: hypothetical protein D6731_24795 [Planctomycetota bacterium]
MSGSAPSAFPHVLSRGCKAHAPVRRRFGFRTHHGGQGSTAARRRARPRGPTRAPRGRGRRPARRRTRGALPPRRRGERPAAPRGLSAARPRGGSTREEVRRPSRPRGDSASPLKVPVRPTEEGA